MQRFGLCRSFQVYIKRFRRCDVSKGIVALVSEVDSSLIFSAFLCLDGLQQEGREEDQRLINLVGESLRLLGNTFVALSDLRCNLACAPPRHLHVVRPMSHYTTPMVLQQAAIPIQVGQGEEPWPEGQRWAVRMIQGGC